jgi:hypothetical protein
VVQKGQDAFDVFVATNPVDEFTLPGPDSAQARDLLARIIATPRQPLAQPARYTRRRLVIAIAVALLALASMAAAWLLTRDVTDPISVICYQDVSLDSPAADAPNEGPLDVDLCKPAWEDRILINEDLTPPGTTPPLVGCVTERGSLAVFPTSDTEACARLGLANINPESVPAGAPLRQLQADLVDHFSQQQCQPMEAAQRDVAEILSANGFSNWQIQLSPGEGGDACASFGLDIETQTVDLIPIP